MNSNNNNNNNSMEIQQSSSLLDVKNLVHRIAYDKKNFNKDQRIVACEQLQEALKQAKDVTNIGCDWRSIIEDLLYCITTRQQSELKRCVSDCLGALGCIMVSQYNDYLKVMLNGAKLIPDKFETDKSLVFKAICSSLNLIGTFGWQSRMKPQDIEAVMTAVKNWLEMNDSPIVLLPLLDICLAISKYFPAVFKQCFDDVVDFTVGWYIEPEQPNTVLEKCHQMLTELRPFWQESVTSGITLMKQFLDDASAYIEDIRRNESKPESTLAKTAAILRALTTMQKVLNSVPVNPHVADFTEKIFGRIIQHLTNLADIYATNIGTVYGQMAEILCISLKMYPRLDLLITTMKALKMMLEQSSINDRIALKLLGYYGKIIDNTAPEAVIEIVNYIIGCEGPMERIIMRSNNVMRGYGNVLGKLLTPKNLSTLQAAYSRVREDVLNCVNALKESETVIYCNKVVIEKKLMIYFSALFSLGIVKNSLIAMMGLSPSLFTFLMTETPITEKWFIVNHPECHYALVSLAKTHSEKHENFIANSSLLIDKNSLTLVAEAATAKHTTVILRTVTKMLLIDDVLWTDTRNLLMDWAYGMIFAISPDVLQQHILDKSEAVEMRAALLDSFIRHSLPKKAPLDNKMTPVFNLVQNGGPEMVAKFVKRIFRRCHLGCQDKITGIWQATPPVLFISNGLTERAQDLMEFGQQKIPESLFTSEHFRIIADFLLNSVIPTYCFSNIDNGYWMSDTATIIYADAMGARNVNNDCISKWRWIIAQMAQFCVDNRLKTPLGKPLDTFLAFENEIRRLAGNALSRKSLAVTASTGKENKEETSKAVTVRNRRGVGVTVEDEEEAADSEMEREPRQLTNSEQWWRVRALLDTIEMLDKVMCYACDGAVFQLSTVSQVSQQFFVTNQTSCVNWLSRLYLPMMAVAYTNNNFAQVIRLGGCALKDIKKRVFERGKKDESDEKGEIDNVAHTCVAWMVKALIELGRPQAVLGLYAWVEKVYGKRYNWIKHASDMASGKIEFALHGLEECLRNENLPENIQKTLRQLIIMGLEMLRSPDEIDVFWRALYGILEPKPDDVPEGFEESAWKRMKSLTAFESNLKNEASSIAVPWDIRTDLIHTELKLMDIERDRFSKDNKMDIVDLTRQLGEDARILMQADTSLQTHTRASALHLLATAVKDSRKPSHKQPAAANLFDPSFLFDWKNGPAAQRIAIAQQLSSWLQHTQNSGTSTLRVIANEPTYHLGIARLARKTKNYRLAETHIKLHYIKRLPTLDAYQQNVLHTLQGNWISNGGGGRVMDKENNVTLTNGIAMPPPIPPVQPRLYSFENFISSYGSSKMIWVVAETMETEQARITVHEKAFSLLINAVADEVDRLLLKGNLIFNGTPTVAPDALVGVLAQQLNHTTIEDSAVVSIGPATKSSSTQNQQQQQQTDDLLAKSIIQLARWLQMEPSLYSVTMNCWMRVAFRMFNRLPAFGPSGLVDALAGAFLSTSCKLSPQLAKAHLELGNWAFKTVTGTHGEVKLSFSTEECNNIKYQIKNACPSVDDSMMENLLQTMQKSANLSAVLPDCKAIAGDVINEQTCDILFGPRSVIQYLWEGANTRFLGLCKCAIHAYFAYIVVSGRNSHKRTIGTVMATLRILHLLVKQYNALHHIISNEMLHTNELLWKDILPQLFARLNHPIRAVRDTICRILERIAASAPHAVCYPAIVGATQPIVIHSGGDDDDEMIMYEKNDFVEVIDEEKKKRAEQDRSLMFECCQRIVTRMQTLFPELVRDVTEFVKELQRIDMLHEERWTFVLTNLDHEMNRRIVQIEVETMKTCANLHLDDNEKKEIIREKAIVLTSLVYRIVEDLYEKTCIKAPLTVNEKQFQEIYLPTIREAMEILRANRTDAHKAWAPFKQLLAQLSQRVSKRSLVSLQMADVSPHLTTLNHTHIPLPGQEHKNFSDVIMLERISKQTIILPTKTRPRKLAFHGSDGKDHPFLFKGQEDLHLDERVMQLLRICNLMLAAKETDWPSYTAENYSVTPLGSRSGLIEWVENATPMFQVYRKWQQRQATGKDIAEVERPSEMFFKKLKAAFHTQNIPKESVADRQKWPQSILKSVVQELIDETPRNLLSRELWLRAGSSDTWFRVTERFARSTAVMSMLGSILGLGDRHLDNVLVNFESGHVVHIDYNVCFDKGRNLRVPETVPFRLTGNIVHALGPTEVEGTFRLSCEKVLMKLRAGKEILLTMLDAFVYDPLVDWAAAQDDLGSKSMIAVATMIAVYGADTHSETLHTMARSLFTLHIKEISAAWLENRDRLQRALISVADILEKLYDSSLKENDTENRSRNWRKDGNNKFETEKVLAGRELKNAITEHHSMMHDIRPLLRSFAHRNGTFAAYLKEYKELFSDPLIRGHKLLDDPGNDFTVCIDLFRSVIGKIPSIYDNLLMLERKLNERVESHQHDGKPTLQERHGEGYERSQQEQNLHGKHVSKRVRMKLDGMDVSNGSGGGKKENAKSDVAGAVREALTPAEQVDLLIQQATDISNLALMYEGWTAWV